MKKFNNSTGCYKIDIFVCGVYFCSTDQSKTCKEAVKRFLIGRLKFIGATTAHFAKI